MPEDCENRINIDKLYDYTKFHIGLYATLVTVTLGVINLGEPVNISPLQEDLLGFVALLFALAGGAGGIVCTNCIRFSSDAEVDRNERCVFWGNRLPVITIQHIANVEHALFWLGILVALYSLTMTG